MTEHDRARESRPRGKRKIKKEKFPNTRKKTTAKTAWPDLYPQIRYEREEKKRNDLKLAIF